MHPLNPFLRAFFRSTVPGQCIPIQQHVRRFCNLRFRSMLMLLKVLLVPLTDVLLNGRDQETGLSYSDLANTEDFLGSHVLRVPNPSASESGKDVTNVRDNRGKAKQFTTFNGRTVIIKESSVFSNKGEPTKPDVTRL